MIYVRATECPHCTGPDTLSQCPTWQQLIVLKEK